MRTHRHEPGEQIPTMKHYSPRREAGQIDVWDLLLTQSGATTLTAPGGHTTLPIVLGSTVR